MGGGILRSAVAEGVGTFILVFAGTSVAVGAAIAKPTAGGSYDSLAIALVFGLALVAIVGSLGHVSGAHVNPAVILALSITRHFPRRYVLPIGLRRSVERSWLRWPHGSSTAQRGGIRPTLARRRPPWA